MSQPIPFGELVGCLTHRARTVKTAEWDGDTLVISLPDRVLHCQRFSGTGVLAKLLGEERARGVHRAWLVSGRDPETWLVYEDGSVQVLIQDHARVMHQVREALIRPAIEAHALAEAA